MTLNRRHKEIHCHGQLAYRFNYEVLRHLLTSHSNRYKANSPKQLAADSQRCTMPILLNRKDFLKDLGFYV